MKKNIPVLAFVCIALFLAAWLPRMIGIDQSVTVDEPKWLTRSANFYQAIAKGRVADTYQSEHPGVTIMWAGTLGFLYRYPSFAQDAPGPFTWEPNPQLERWLARTDGPRPLDLLHSARWWIVFAVAAIIAVAFFPLRSLFGFWPAILISLFVAWDPFFVALSRELHPDALLASLIYLSLLFFLAWLYDHGPRRTLVLSGVAMGLAWLTKTPAIFLTVSCGLLALIHLYHQVGGRKRFVLDMVLWAVVAIVTAVLLWPALWMGPISVWNQVSEAMGLYMGGHENPSYFLGANTDDPGILYYPIALVLRSTPASLIGLICAAVLALRSTWPFSHQRQRLAAGGLLTFALVFMIGMSLGNKQFDRYMLPADIALDVIAALGLLGVAQAVVNWTRPGPVDVRNPGSLTLPARAAVFATLGVMLLAHIFPGLRHAPYYLTYYNPLFGGTRVAEKILMVGWGEGLKEAADWINRQPDGGSANIVSWYRQGSLSYFLESDRPVLDYGQIEFWADADYAVVYVNQRQRRLPTPRTIETIEAGEPAFVVEQDGVDLVRVYARHDLAPPDWSGVSTTSAAVFDKRIQLVGHSLGEQTYLAGDSLLVRFYLRQLEAGDSEYARIALLVDDDRNEIWRDEIDLKTIFAGAAPFEIVYDHLDIQLPQQAPDGEYLLTVEFIGPEGFKAIDGKTPRLVTVIEVRNSVEIYTDADWGMARISALLHEPEIRTGKPFIVLVEAKGTVDGTLKASMRLVNPDGKTMAQIDRPLLDKTQFELELPDDANPGRYSLTVVVYDADTLASFPDQQGQHGTEISVVTVH